MSYNKIALVFPGQGSQYKDMGKILYDAHESVRHIFNQASGILGYDLAEVCFKKSPIRNRLRKIKIPVGSEPLDRTLFAQPAILTTSYAILKTLEERCADNKIELNPYLVMGHSFGEYTALIASGATDFETALRLVQRRAELMTESLRDHSKSGLMAIRIPRQMTIETSEIEHWRDQFKVYLALNNTDRQIVVGGTKKNLKLMKEYLEEERMIVKILDGAEGAFHTPLMQEAARKFKKDLDQARIYIASIPIIANVTAKAMSDPEDIRDELYGQIYKPVNWRGSVEKAIADEVELFIEVGPGQILSDMIRSTKKDTEVSNVEDTESLEKTVEMLRKVEPPG